MYADAVARITESMFPIFFIGDGGGVDSVAVRGTGFFVDTTGVFLTAHHVVAGAPPGSTPYFYGKIPDDVCEPAVEIEHLASDPAHDLFVGRVARDYLEPVAFAREPVRPGDSVCLAGYPMPVLSISPRGGLVGTVRRYWQPTFVIDATQVLIGKRTYDGYIVQNPCLVGMSGGPVFDVEGKLRGMAAATVSRTVPDVGGNATAVSNGVVIDVEHLQTFLDTSLSRLATRT